MNSWARVGARCICIMASSKNPFEGLALVEGQTYVVAALSELGSQPSAHFKTLSGQDIHSGGVLWISRFRPLITKSQEDDISMFKSLLKPTEVPA